LNIPLEMRDRRRTDTVRLGDDGRKKKL
jgi:hypothetical protein